MTSSPTSLICIFIRCSRGTDLSSQHLSTVVLSLCEQEGLPFLYRKYMEVLPKLDGMLGQVEVG